jgi:hypothetical protein
LAEAFATQQQRGSPHIDLEYLGQARAAAEQMGLKEGDHPVSEEEIVALVTQQYEWAQANLTRVYARAIEAWLWFVGQHHLRIDDVRRRFVRNEQVTRIPRPTINLILEKVESVAGDLSKGIVVGKIVPNSNDPRDRLGSQAAEKIRQFKWELDRMDELQRSLIQGAVISGDMFTLTEIDTDANEQVEIEVPLPDGTSTPIKLSLADAKTRLLLPIQIFFNPGATGVGDARFRHVHLLQGEEFIKEQYPHLKDHILGNAQDHPLANWQWRLQEMMMHELSSSGLGSVWNRGQGHFNNIEKQTIVHHVEFPKSRLYPEGRLFITAGSGVAYAGKLPLGRSLITQFRYTPIENSPWSLGLVHPLINLNKHIEAAVAQNTLSRKVAAVPFWLTPLQSGGSFAEANLKADVGAIYKYRPGTRGEKPELVQGRHPADAGYVADMQMFIQEFFERVSGAKQVLVGERPQGISAGIALRQLIQRASVRFAPKVSAANRHHEEMESNRMYAIANSPAWSVPRRVSVPGRAGRRSIGYYKAADMRDNYTYRVEAEPKGVQDEVSKAQTVLDAIGNGLVNVQDPRNRMKALDLLGIGDDGFVDENSVDIRHAESKIAALLDGEEVEIGPFDNYGIHYQITLDYMKTEQFELADPVVKQRIVAHAMELQQRLLMVQTSAMHRQAAMDDRAEAIAGGEPEAPMPQLEPGMEMPGGPTPQNMAVAGPQGAPGPGQGPPAMTPFPPGPTGPGAPGPGGR